MKRILMAILALSSTLSADAPTSPHDDLRAFIELAQTCKASAEKSTDAEALETYTTVTKIARTNSTALQRCDILNETQAADLCSAIATSLQTAQLPKRQPDLTPHTARQTPSLHAIVQTFKKDHEEKLLKPTPLGRRTVRIALKTAVELAHDMYTPKKPKSKNVPDLRQRLSDMADLKFPDYQLRSAAGYAVLKTATDAMINEYLPAGLLTQSQKLTELMLPPVLAGIIHAQIIKQGYGSWTNRDDDKKVFWGGLTKGCVTLPVLTRCCLDRSHPLYKWVNLLAYVLPFFMGPTGRKVGAKGIFRSVNNLGNAVVDGGLSMAVYDGIPALVDLALRKLTTSLQLNPKHRRKMIQKFVRDPLWLATSQWMAASFM